MCARCWSSIKLTEFRRRNETSLVCLRLSRFRSTRSISILASLLGELRLFPSFRRQREYLDPALCHRNRVFELRRQGAVTGDGGPAVGQHLHVRTAEIDHWLD